MKIEKLIALNASALARPLEVGSLVRARYKKQSKFFRGRIARVLLDGTYEIHYDDGDKEKGLPREYIEVSACTSNISRLQTFGPKHQSEFCGVKKVS